MRHGHSVTLYAYEPVTGVPEGVALRDAAAVVPAARLIRHQSGSVALFSDLFRFEVQRQGLGTWIDCDMYFVGTLDADSPYLFGREDGYFINTGVLRLPAGSPLLADLIGIFDQREIPFWLPARHRALAWLRRTLTGRTAVERMPWGAAGPKALTALAAKHDVAQLARPPEAFCPVNYRDARWILDPSIALEDMVGRDTVAVHLWNDRIAAFKDSPAPERSFLAQLQAEGRQEERARDEPR
ncbi:hypothetical protein BXU08_00330 [Sphingomonas sp. LM7]|nr:hypothetical protein BXU08_00330 [Sphingomonas sp. LM7]